MSLIDKDSIKALAEEIKNLSPASKEQIVRSYSAEAKTEAVTSSVLTVVAILFLILGELVPLPFIRDYDGAPVLMITRIIFLAVLGIITIVRVAITAEKISVLFEMRASPEGYALRRMINRLTQ